MAGMVTVAFPDKTSDSFPSVSRPPSGVYLYVDADLFISYPFGTLI